MLEIHSVNGIAEERFVSIGGIDQWIGIRGEDFENPALLIIHGGPGSPCSIFTPLLRSWERYFTVVQWDQRGAGKTLGRSANRRTGDLTMEQLIRDAVEVAEYVRARLRKDKIILLATSFGSTFALPLIRRRPDLFAAYVGVDQNTGMLRNRETNYKNTLERLRSLKLAKGVALLEKIGPDPSLWTSQDFLAYAQWTMKSDPVTCEKSMKLLKSSLWFSPGHTLRDIMLFLSGMKLSAARLFPEFRSYDAWRVGTRFEIPFFIFQGENDVITPPDLAEQYFDDVVAPIKAFKLIRGTGHFAAFTEPEQFLEQLLNQVHPCHTGSVQARV